MTVELCSRDVCVTAKWDPRLADLGVWSFDSPPTMNRTLVCASQ